jgi:hypothetical protein
MKRGGEIYRIGRKSQKEGNEERQEENEYWRDSKNEGRGGGENKRKKMEVKKEINQKSVSPDTVSA